MNRPSHSSPRDRPGEGAEKFLYMFWLWVNVARNASICFISSRAKSEEATPPGFRPQLHLSPAVGSWISM